MMKSRMVILIALALVAMSFAVVRAGGGTEDAPLAQGTPQFVTPEWWITLHYTDTVPTIEIAADFYPMTTTCQVRDEAGSIVAEQVMTRTVPVGTEVGPATDPISVTWALELPLGLYQEWCQIEVLNSVYAFNGIMDGQHFFKTQEIMVQEDGEWYVTCPLPLPTSTPQPTYTPRPTDVPRPTQPPAPTPTCRPTWTPAPTPTLLPTDTPYPTPTHYPTYTPYPPQPPF